MKLDRNTLGVIAVVVAVVILYVALYMWYVRDKKREYMSGYGVVSGLAFNNKNVQCYPESPDGARSAYCTTGARVMV